MPAKSILQSRENYSLKRIELLRKYISEIKEIGGFPELTIFGAGSYARLEASQYSDVDMFFLNTANPTDIIEPKTSQIRLFAKIIEIADEMKFPKFSNDGEFLHILHMKDSIIKLGGRQDDYENHFTSRMLLLLESKYLYNEDAYEKAVKKIVKSCFRDYPRHKNDFRPLFLMNDIIRYWKTICLNYENKRNGKTQDPIKKTRLKVRNFKIKFSRMTTCYATIGALSCPPKITEPDVINLVKLTPRQRLQQIPSQIPETKDIVKRILDEYTWFLSMTSLTTGELEEYFSDKEKAGKAVCRANEFGGMMYEMLKVIDVETNTLRYLVI